MRIIAFFFCVFAIQMAWSQQKTEELDMFMGTDNAGNCIVGPRLPYGSSHPSPDTKNGGGDGYSFGQPLFGFSQMHASGAGGDSQYGNFLISPQVGLSVNWDEHFSNISQEMAKPYLYECLMDRYQIKASVVPTLHGAMYKFTFSQSDTASIVLDCGHSVPQTIMKKSNYGAESGELTIESDSLIAGWGIYSGGWLYAPYKVYFAMSVSKKPNYKGVFLNNKKNAGQNSVKTIKAGDRFGAWLSFSTTNKEDVLVRITVSMKSVENAKQFLMDELENGKFETLKKTAQQSWEKQLSKINIKGGSVDQRSLFYTCLMRTMLTPSDRTGDAPLWNSNDAYWDDQFCVWDTWRTQFPLMLLLNPDKYSSNIQSFIKRFEMNRRVDDAFISGIESMTIEPDFRQGGDDVTNIIADGYAKKAIGIDWNKAFEIVKNQADSMRWPSYLKEGKLYFGQFRNPASTQLEFCYNDYLAASMAKGLRHKADAQKYAKRAQSWEYFWNPNIEDDGYKGFIQNQKPDGSWIFYAPKKKDLNGPQFYEGSSWVYSYFMPHNFKRLIELCGGKKKYAERLEHALKNNLIDYSNEPSFMTIRSFIDAGRPDLCSYWVGENMKKYTLKAYPGDDDSGAMSSWYVFSALGFFPNAGTDTYYLNAPLFPAAEISLPEGKVLRIIADNSGDGNIYIQSATLNGKALKKATITHKDIISGGTLKFVLSNKPNKWGND
jgi:predicted alpha-1,2-mannosidase